MFCPNCGTNVGNAERFCPNCGAALNQNTASANPQPNPQPNYQQPNYQQPNYQQPNYQQPNYQQPNYQQPNYQPVYQQPVQQYPYPMNWYKFVIYFALFAGAVINAISGILHLTGSVWEMQDVSADMVYAVFGGMQAVDIIYGIGAIALAAFNIVTRMHLAKFRKTGPKFLSVCYGVAVGLALLYIILTSAVTGISIGDLVGATEILQLVVSIVMLVVNVVYFNKRASLFVN